MVASVDRRICFRPADTIPVVPLVGPVRLGDGPAEALSELLQVFACGEESASLAFARLGVGAARGCGAPWARAHRGRGAHS
jgi:hypothetical protein